jgi:hypothetical protein
LCGVFIEMEVAFEEETFKKLDPMIDTTTR